LPDLWSGVDAQPEAGVKSGKSHDAARRQKPGGGMTSRYSDEFGRCDGCGAGYLMYGGQVYGYCRHPECDGEVHPVRFYEATPVDCLLSTLSELDFPMYQLHTAEAVKKHVARAVSEFHGERTAA
jgi:hypothetical protein